MGRAADIMEAAAACRGDGNFGEPFFMVGRFRLSFITGNRQAAHLHAGNQGDFQYEKDSLLHGAGSYYDKLQLGHFYLGGRSRTHCRNKHGILHRSADDCTLWRSISA